MVFENNDTLISGCPVLTAVNSPQHICAISGCRLPYYPERVTIYIAFPVVQTDGQTYGQVTTKILAVDKQPNFLSYGAPLAIALRKNKKADYNPHKIRLTR